LTKNKKYYSIIKKEEIMGYQQGIVYFIDILGSKNINGFDKKYIINSVFHNALEKNQSMNQLLNHTIYELVYMCFQIAHILYIITKKIYLKIENKYLIYLVHICITHRLSF
jgi:hypothetical protein